MKTKKTKITDLNFDVLKHIMLFVSKSSDGAKDLARALAVNRVFKELAEEPKILEAVTFADVNILETHKSFWQPNGFLFRCIRARNLKAYNIAIQYSKMLNASSKVMGNEFHLVKTKLTRSFTKCKTVNTRARKRTLKQAYSDYLRYRPSAEECYNKAVTFSKELKEAIIASGLVSASSQG